MFVLSEGRGWWTCYADDVGNDVDFYDCHGLYRMNFWSLKLYFISYASQGQAPFKVFGYAYAWIAGLGAYVGWKWGLDSGRLGGVYAHGEATIFN